MSSRILYKSQDVIRSKNRKNNTTLQFTTKEIRLRPPTDKYVLYSQEMFQYIDQLKYNNKNRRIIIMQE